MFPFIKLSGRKPHQDQGYKAQGVDNVVNNTIIHG